MPVEKKRIRVKSHKRKGKSRVWKTRYVKVHRPAKPAAPAKEAASE